MTMGISIEPILPLAPNRPATAPAEDAAGRFEEVFRAEPQPRRPDAAPADGESPSTSDSQAGPSGNASGDVKDEAAPDDSKELDEADAAETPETSVVSAPPPTNAAQPEPSAHFDAANGSADIAGEKTALKSGENSHAKQDAVPETSGGAAPAPQSPELVEDERGTEKAKPAKTFPIVAAESQPEAEGKRGDPRSTAAGTDETSRREVAAAAARDGESIGAMDAAVQAAETAVTDRPSEQLGASLDSITKLTETPKDPALPEAVSHETPAKSNRSLDEQPRSSSAFNDADAKALRLSSSDRVRFVQRVARAIEAARPDGEIRLRLRPPALGSIHLRVRTEDGVLAARVETETRHAQTLLAQRVPELRERLAEMNIRVERFDVEWRGAQEERSSSFGQNSGPGDRDYGLPRPAQRRNDGGERPTAETPRTRLHRGDLDVLV